MRWYAMSMVDWLIETTDNDLLWLCDLIDGFFLHSIDPIIWSEYPEFRLQFLLVDWIFLCLMLHFDTSLSGTLVRQKKNSILTRRENEAQRIIKGQERTFWVAALRRKDLSYLIKRTFLLLFHFKALWLSSFRTSTRMWMIPFLFLWWKKNVFLASFPACFRVSSVEEERKELKNDEMKRKSNLVEENEKA